MHTMLIHENGCASARRDCRPFAIFSTPGSDYSAVYLHKKTRIADQMLLRIAERSILDLDEFPHFETMSDDQILSGLAQRSADPWFRDWPSD